MLSFCSCCVLKGVYYVHLDHSLPNLHTKVSSHCPFLSTMASVTLEWNIMKISPELFTIHVSQSVSTNVNWKVAHLSQIYLNFEYNTLICQGRLFRREPQRYNKFYVAHAGFVGHGWGDRFAYLTPSMSGLTGHPQCFLSTAKAPTPEFILGLDIDLHSTMKRDGEWELSGDENDVVQQMLIRDTASIMR